MYLLCLEVGVMPVQIGYFLHKVLHKMGLNRLSGIQYLNLFALCHMDTWVEVESSAIWHCLYWIFVWVKSQNVGVVVHMKKSVFNILWFWNIKSLISH